MSSEKRKRWVGFYITQGSSPRAGIIRKKDLEIEVEDEDISKS